MTEKEFALFSKGMLFIGNCTCKNHSADPGEPRAVLRSSEPKPQRERRGEIPCAGEAEEKPPTAV